MSLLDTILQATGGQDKLAQQFGLDNNQVSAALSQLVPALNQGVKKNAGAPGGLEALLGAISGGNHQKYLDNPDALGDEATTNDGNAILGHLLGSKDVSRSVASRASEKTGIDEGILKKMLPVVATMVMGSLSKNQSNFTSGDQPSANMLTQLLDADGDGPMDDVVGMFKKFL